MDQSPDLDLRPGQRWRFANGSEVSISKVEGDYVSGALNALVSVGGSPTGPSGMVAGYEGHRNDFQGAEMLVPRWRAKLEATVEGENVRDVSFQLLQGVATVERRSTPVLKSEQNAVRGDLAFYEAELVAVDAEVAEQTICEALGERLHSITVKPI
jgi:hypothetical protein